MDERGRRMRASGALGVLAIALGGCLAPIRETRLEGPSRPSPEARSEVTVERRVTPTGPIECRAVVATAPMERDVVIRRSFVDSTQDRNGALAMLLGAGAGILVFSKSQVACSGSGACGAPGAAASVLLGVAVIPLGFLAYNALAVRDREVVESVPPEARPGGWGPCSP